MKIKLIAALAVMAYFSVNAASISTDLECKTPSGDITFPHNTVSFPRHLEIQGNAMPLRDTSEIFTGNATTYIYSIKEDLRGYIVMISKSGNV